jgi:hypothetical protein
MFDQPAVGTEVYVKTRFRNIFFYATEEFDEHVYRGVVGRPDRSVPEGSFMLLTPDDARMPTRVIALRNVIELKYADGASVKKAAAKSDVKVWQVQGSKGNVYTVTQRGSDKSCTCPGFQFRKDCRHVNQ